MSQIKLELLSTNLVQIIDRCLNSEALTKLLFYNGNNPLSNPSVNKSAIAPLGAEQRVLPSPFDIKFKDEERSQLHVYYPQLKFVNNNNVEQAIVWFDIVVHKRLWLYSQDGNKLVRPYDIASEIARLFDGTIPNSKSTIGKLDFLAMAHVAVNEQFDAVRLEAKMTTF